MDCGLSAGILAAGPDHELTPSDVASPCRPAPETASLTSEPTEVATNRLDGAGPCDLRR